MTTIANLIGPIYQNLLIFCEKHKIALNLDLQSPSQKIEDEKLVNDFLKKQIIIAIKSCKANDKITIAQSNNIKDDFTITRITIKFSGKSLTSEEKQELIDKGYEVRSRFGYDTSITLKIAS